MISTPDILERLIAFPTIPTASNPDIIDYIRGFLDVRGFRIHLIQGHEPGKQGLYAEIGPQSDGGILLSGHTDVVPVEGQDWTCDPFRLTRDGDRLVGRGTTDMKGYLAAMLRIADCAARLDLKAPLKLVFSYDEEIGCVGIQNMLDPLRPLLGTPRVCIVGEPTSMAVATGHKGKAALRATCFGQNGHSALAPYFINALHLAVDFVSEIREIQARYEFEGARDDAYAIPYTTLHVGKISGGMALNIVPDKAELTFEYRHLAADNPEHIMRRLQEAADQVAKRYQDRFESARIELDRYNAYPGLDTAKDDQAAILAQRLAGHQDITKVPFGTEAGFFADLGIPTVVCGPGSMEDQGHKPDESIEISQLDACDRMMDRILSELSV